MKGNNYTINFMQYNLYNYINAPKNKSFFTNIMTEYGINHSKSAGYCYGLANEFLIYNIDDKGADYIQQLNYLYDITSYDRVGLSAIDKARYDALKMHAQVLLNEYIYDFIKIQAIRDNSLRNRDYFDGLTYDKINNRMFGDYFNDIIDKNLKKATKVNEKNKIYYQYIYESQKIKFKEYINALYANKDFFNTKEGEVSSSDPIFLKLKEKFIRGNLLLESKYSVSDAHFFIDSISESINRDNYLKLELTNNQRGIKGNNIHQNYSFNTLEGTTVKRFKDVIIAHTAKNKTPLYYQLILGNHAVVISAKYNNKNQSWEYSFFDPNSGVTTINKQIDFFSYLDDHIKINAEKNKIPIFDNDYNITVSEFKKNGNSGSGFKKINKISLKITENVLLAERKITYQQEGSKCKIIYKEFNPENCLLKIKVIVGSVEFIAYTDILDGQDLYTRIVNNPETISKIKKDVFISQDGYKIYSINKDFDIKTFENINKSHNNQNIARDYISVNLHLKPLSNNESKPITGIPENHQRAITQVANDYNIIIGMRPIDYKSTSLIASGLYSSKGLSIKGKSSDWGPHSGFIPILQQFAKKSARDEQEKYNDYVTQSIEQGHAKAVILEVTHERMNELLKYKVVEPLVDVSWGEYSSRTSAKVDNVSYHFVLKNITRGESKVWQVYHLSGNKINPFLVVGDPKTGKAMTADYDLFSVIFSVSELEHYVRVSEMPSWKEWKASVNYDELTNEQKKLYQTEAEYNKREGKDNGITNTKIKEINRDLNKKLGRPVGLELVHHGADDANPGSVMKDNFPITFFLPDKLKGKNKLSGTSQSIDTYFQMNSSGTVIINDVESLSNFQQLLINEGYRAPLNANWCEGEYADYFNPKRKISDSFINARREIQRKKSIPIVDQNFIEGKENQKGYIDNNFGKPIAKLDMGFGDIQLDEINTHNNGVLAGEQSSSIESLEHWSDPIDKYRKLQQQDAETVRKIKPTEYDYNVIVQIEGDEIAARATGNAFSKHPDDSMVIQYNMTNKQYKILHGDLQRIKKGKVRWITVGHGIYYGNNEPTLYAGKNAAEYVNSILYLQNKILKSKSPDKLVLLGCNLARGGPNENFVIKIIPLLAEYNVRIPVVAYNRMVSNIYLGNKLVMPIDGDSDSVSTDGYKFTYQYNTGSEQVRINGKSSVLYFINEVRRGEITLNQLNDYIEPDPMRVFRDLDTRTLDMDLLKKVIYNHDAYKLFVNELKRHKGNLPDDFYFTFNEKINELGIKETPIWKMVSSERILNRVSNITAQNISELTVIIRLTDDRKGLLQSERLAARDPHNTLIFQMDVENKKSILEYGSADLISLVEENKITNWVIIGDTDIIRKPTGKLASELLALKNKYPLINPENILYHSVGPAMITDAAEHKVFLMDLSANLKSHGMTSEVKSKYTHDYNHHLASVNNDTQSTSFLGGNSHQSLITLLEKISLKEVLIQDITKVEHPYLLNYFSDENGGVDIEKLKIAVSDPLINKRLNDILSQNKDFNTLSMNLLLESSLSNSYQQQAEYIHTLLIEIKNDLSLLNNLSENSKLLLSKIFPAGDGFNGVEFNKGKVLDLVTDDNKFILLSNNLKEFSSSNLVAEEAQLRRLSFSEVFKTYENNQAQRLKQFNQLLSYGYKVGLINHDIIRLVDQPRVIDQTLGGMYGIEFYFTGSDTARDIIERKAQLERIKFKGTLTSAERSLLIKMDEYSHYINTVVRENSILVVDQSLLNLFSTVSGSGNAIIFIKGKSATYTVMQVNRNGSHEISLFDPQGIQFSIKNRTSEGAQWKFQQKIKHYFNEDIQLADGKFIARGKNAGLEVMKNGNFRADFQVIDLDFKNIKKVLPSLQNQRESIIEQTAFSLPKNRWVTINGEKVSFVKLQQLGATIEGRTISLSDFDVGGQHKKIRFSPEKLSTYFTLMEGGKEDLSFIKVFHEQLKSADIYQLVERKANFAESGALKKQFKYLASNIDAQQDAVASSTLLKVRQAGNKLPKYHRIANHAGQVMGAAGAIQSLISAYAILAKLDNPDISVEESKELEKQFYLLVASAFFNYGDMIVQPMLLSIASSKGTSSLFRSRLAMGTVVIFNLIGMGIDAYQAYDSLSKLDSVTDPKQREDIIVNATFSIVGSVINGVTVIGVLVGSSTIPVIGLVVGGVLLVGGWVYNGIRAVENIKNIIDIDWDRELEEGIRGAFGLEPTLRSQQEMSNQHQINAFKNQDWDRDLILFESNIQHAGFGHHLSIVEKPISEPLQRYYLVDNHRNYFHGTFSTEKLGSGNIVFCFLRNGAPTFTAEEADFILQIELARNRGWFKRLKTLYKSYESIEPDYRKKIHFKREAKEIIDLKPIGRVSTNEHYSLNTSYKNPLFDEFKARHQVLDNNLSLPLDRQLKNSASEQINFYSTNTQFSVFGQRLISADERFFSENLVNNTYRTALHIESTFSQGISWNTANGNDVLIGKKSQKNSFQVLLGEKYFAGGDSDDLFFMRDCSVSSLMSRGGKLPTKYLDGQGGQDTVIIDSLPKNHQVLVDLNANTLNYQEQSSLIVIPAANLQAMENVVVRGNSDDTLQGNDAVNILDGGLGFDVLEGKGGDDLLILTQGRALGGDGNDSYRIRRFDWSEHVSDFYLTERYFDIKEKVVKTRRYHNPVYIQGNRIYQTEVMINEYNRSQSRVNLEYSLDEIIQIRLSGNNLVLTIKLADHVIGGQSFANVESEVSIVLENVFESDGDSKTLHHIYQLQTRDGWVMTTQQDKTRPHQYFSLSYIQEYDKLPAPEHKSVKIDELANCITINQSRCHIAPEWGWFTPIGRAEHLSYYGNDKNNLLPLIKSGSYIEISRGIDTYQIVQGKDEYGQIEFDFSKVKDSFTKSDSVNLLLPTENGYSLHMDGYEIYSINNSGKKQLDIKFTNVGEHLTEVVLLQDKHSNVFKVNLKEGFITPIKPVMESSDHADQIILPAGYISEEHVIDGGNGDDIIISRSLDSYVLLGGKGDDNIKASVGNNVLYGGAGINSVSGGLGDDLLLSSDGSDALMGGEGSDHYVIEGNQAGGVYIVDDAGHNHIHLVNFKNDPIKQSNEEYLLYSSAGGKIVKIKRPSDDSAANFSIHHYERLDEKFIASTGDGMTPLVNYLSKKLHEEKHFGELATWKPTEKLADTLKGLTVKPVMLTAGNDGRTLQPDSRRDNWFIDALSGNDEIIDMTEYGRVIKGGGGNDKLIATGGENVLYGGQGNDVLLAQGMHQDVLISLDGEDQLSADKGDDLYIISGHGEGDVTVTDFAGRNKLLLIGFERNDTDGNQLSATVTETKYESKSGRVVTLRHNNHLNKVANVTEVNYLNDHRLLSKQNIDQTVERLIQLLAEQRIAYESNLDSTIKNGNYRKNWGAAQITEHFLSNLK